MERLIGHINSILPMSTEDLALLTPLRFELSIKKKANLLVQGDVCKNIYFLTKGFFRMYYIDLEGNEINTRFTKEDNFMVDFQSFLTQKPSRYYWQAMEDSTVFAFAFKTSKESMLPRPHGKNLVALLPSGFTCN